MHGYHSQYLLVNATSATSQRVAIPEHALRNFLGGTGLGAWLLHELGASQFDPLAAEAPLAFVFSPLVGSPLTTSAKFAVVSRGPLTDRYNDSLASSQFALAGKRTGADVIVITGRAPQPSVLVIDGHETRLEPAGDAWGCSCADSQELLKRRFGPDFACAVIGPAGERLVRYATISHDGRHAGRGGGGAVLGAKRIKAILVRGQQRATWAQPQELHELARDLSRRSFGPATAKYRELGTATNLLAFNRLHALPTRNFQAGSFAEAAAIAPETLAVAHQRTRASCAACTIGCEHIYELSPQGAEAGKQVRLEYENLFALGPLCGVGHAEHVLKASSLCDELGLDTISTGGTIAFAMECVERGYLHAPWLRFGSGEAVLRAIELIGRRQELGDLLAEGSRRLALHLGHDTLDFAPQVKGLEIPGYEPRALQTMALGFAVGTRGADHNRSGAYEVDFSDRVERRNVGPEAAAWAVETEDKAALMDSLILCKFLRGVFTDFYAEAAHMLGLVTGWNVTADELRGAARRIVTAKKRFNVACGWTPAEDTLPARFLTTALADDAQARLTRERLAQLITAYNAARGWSESGYPPA